MKTYQQYFLADVIFCAFMFMHFINSHVLAEMPATLVRPLATLFCRCSQVPCVRQSFAYLQALAVIRDLS